MVVVILFLLAALGLSFLVNLAFMGRRSISDPGRDLREEYFSRDKYRTGTDKIAILSVEGAILGTDGFVKEQIDQIRGDDDVKGVVLRVDSPGGSVSASDFYYHHLRKLRTELDKPIVVSMGSMAASGGYYIAMAAGPVEQTIFAEPTTFTGSIGVMIPHFVLADLLDHIGVEENSIVSHPLKSMGSLARNMTEEERAIFQELVDEGFERFKTIIRDNRPRFQENGGDLEKLATGQIFTAEQAKQGGLIDEIGFLEEAIERAIELAGVDAEAVQVIRYQETPTLASLFFGANAQGYGLDLSRWIDMTAPRLYYLATELPPLVRSGP